MAKEHNILPIGQPGLEVKQFTIENGQTESATVAVRGMSAVLIECPAAIDGVGPTLTFKGGSDADDLAVLKKIDNAGTGLETITVPVEAGAKVVLPAETLAGPLQLRLVASATQTADRDFFVTFKKV